MSRLTSMSPEALRQIFSPDSDSDLITLLTIYKDKTGEILARIADGYTGRINEDEVNVVYGVVSNGESYTFLPMQITLPTEEEGQAPRCSITMYDVTRYLIPIVRTITEAPRVVLQLVLNKTPDIVEIEFTDFYISNFNYSANSVTAELSMTDYSTEPFPVHAFTPQHFPGLF